jgi:hypothetical protein
MSPRWTCAGGVLAAVVWALPLGADASPAPRFAPLSAWDTAALERARAGAVRRLAQAECQRVLSDFVDAGGRTLRASLEPWGLTPAEYLQQAVSFRDGATLPVCRKANVFLVTPPGQVAVFVCPRDGALPGSRFARVQVDNPFLAEAMVIHEMLHTLGLGENPPTTFEITDRVVARCR